MEDFQFLKIPDTTQWVILDPKRAKRPDAGKKLEQICPFCVGHEKQEQEVYRVGGTKGDTNWQILSVANKYPLTSIHEIIIHSPDHHKNFEELPLRHIELVLNTYRHRFREYHKKGQIYIFHNRGIKAGESIPHPHSQLTIIPKKINLGLPPLDQSIYKKSFFGKPKQRDDVLSSGHFYIYCPLFSQWPDEVWLAPHRKNTSFAHINDKEITDLAFCLQRLINIFDARHRHEFPFNFYIYPGKNWYLRIIPRLKILGGFELGTGIMVNTQDPSETMAFIRDHFQNPDLYKIRIAQQAEYWKSV